MTLLTGVYAETPLNTSEIPKADLNIENKLRSNPLGWNGQFSPQLIQVLLNRYAGHGMVVFDPFLGSGTTLLEAGIANLAASGTEINPAAIALAQTYKFVNVSIEKRRFHLDKVSSLLQSEFLNTFPLFQAIDQNGQKQDTKTLKQKLMRLPPLIEERLQYQLLETLIALLDFFKPNLSADRVFMVWSKLAQHVMQLPFSQQPIEVYHADARKTPLPNSSVDMVITSPPYINVFNYHQQYRASMEALNWNLLKVAKSEIGANRKHRSNRFLTVIQYCLDISQVFNELLRVCRPQARLIFIVGRESTVLGTPFFNGEIVAEIAYRALGFDLMLKQERVFLNRYGQNIYEDILHFSPPTREMAGAFLECARDVAQEVLEAAYLKAPEKARVDIKSTLENINTVQPSPLFNLLLEV
ncbi:MAG: hypothetical protein L6R45_03490 [Anaerolineae bacterium]|nr:hypothetical protein [Anaerolineae bacterium]